jgi:alpha-glucosidase (family GH31 glycosyl hydrolase)
MEPYFTSQSIQGVVEKGHPIMRPMLLEYPNDKTCWFLDQQYMLGSDLLVAPVFGESDVDFYVPSGVFTNILTGTEVSGPAWVSETHSMSSLPLLLRPDAALVIGKAGHSVLDNINKRGFTLVVSRQISKPLQLKTSLRADQVLSLDITPVMVDGGLVGYDIAHTGSKVNFDVLVIGSGKGLDSEKTLPNSLDNSQSCQIRW